MAIPFVFAQGGHEFYLVLVPAIGLIFISDGLQIKEKFNKLRNKLNGHYKMYNLLFSICSLLCYLF